MVYVSAVPSVGYYTRIPIDQQYRVWRTQFPQTIRRFDQPMSRRRLPLFAEHLFKVPNPGAVAPSYDEARRCVLDLLGLSRNGQFLNYFNDEGSRYERQSSAKCAWRLHTSVSPKADAIDMAAQFGIRHQRVSADACTALLKSHRELGGFEYPLGVYEVAAMLYTHPDRFTGAGECLGIICAGDRIYPRHSNHPVVPAFRCHDGLLELVAVRPDRVPPLCCGRYGIATGFTQMPLGLVRDAG